MILCYPKNILAEEISENILLVLRSTFQFSVESVPGLHWLCFNLLYNWSRELDHSLSPSDVKVTPITTWKFAFSRASGNLVVFTFNSHQLIKYFPFLDSKSALIQNNWKAINRCERLGPKH